MASPGNVKTPATITREFATPSRTLVERRMMQNDATATTVVQ
jgi:hypothetical protein